MDKSLNSFIDFLIQQKKLKFSVDEIQIDTSLVKNGILKIENDQVFISDYLTLSQPFFERYKQKLNIAISGSFVDNVEFINAIEKDFNSKGFATGYLDLSREIWKSVIKESNKDHARSFAEYLTSVDSDNKPDGIYEFMEAYGMVLPELDVSEDEIIDNFLIMAEITKSETDYNIDLGNVLNGIRKLCKDNYDRGLQLLQKSLDLGERKDILISAVVTGLYENKGTDFFKLILEKLMTEENNRNPILFGLSNVSDLSDVDCKLFLHLIKKYRDDEKLTISVLSLVFSVLKSKHIPYHQICFEELESAVENENTANYILRNINLVHEYKDEKTNLVDKFIHQKYFSVDIYIQQIAQTIRRLKDVGSLKQIILSIINVSPFTHFIRKSNTFLYKIDKTEIDKLMIGLLTDNAASKRFIGLEIFQEMSRQQPYTFTLEILSLTPILQYKLWMTLTSDFHQPKDRLTALMPLLNSESELVKESFLCKLEEISEDYGGQVLEVLEKNLDVGNAANSKMKERIKNHIRDFHDRYTNSKNALSELDPYRTHFRHIQKFNDLFHKDMGKKIDKGARENSFLSMIGTGTVQLSKGGGWRFGTKNEIAQLSSFGTSLTMPRSYFINSNQYEYEKGILMQRDWNDEEFETIIQIIENE